MFFSAPVFQWRYLTLRGSLDLQYFVSVRPSSLFRHRSYLGFVCVR